MAALTNAVQSFLMGQQMRQQMDARNRQQQANELFGQVMMGGGSPEQMQQLASLNPQMFMQAQGQQKAQQLDQLRTSAAQGDQAAMNELMVRDPQGFATLQNLQSNINKRQQEAAYKRAKIGSELDKFQEASFEQIAKLPEEMQGAAYEQFRAQAVNRFGPDMITAPEQMTPEIGQFIKTSLQKEDPTDIKVGRYRSIKSPDGSMYTFDSSTGTMDLVQAGDIRPVTKLSAGMEKTLNSTIDEAYKAGTMAKNYEVLAQDVGQIGDDFGSGLFSSWEEDFKKMTGSQDAVSDLKRRYNDIRITGLLGSLPPGVASDKDIEMAQKGLPADNANSETVQSYLRGMAKLEKEKERFLTFKSEWISQIGNTGSAKTRFNLDGVQFDRGDSFQKSYKKYRQAQEAELPYDYESLNIQQKSLIDQLKNQGVSEEEIAQVIMEAQSG